MAAADTRVRVVIADDHPFFRDGVSRGLSRDGRVEVVAEGPRSAVQALLDALNGPGTPGRVRTVVERWAGAHGGITGFVER